jgi:hypothetical protein
VRRAAFALRQTFPEKPAARRILHSPGGFVSGEISGKNQKNQQFRNFSKAAPIGPPLAMGSAGKTPDRQNAGAILPKWREPSC